MGEGELFGFTSLLAEEPLGFVARAAEDTLVYRIPAAVIRPVLERPSFVRFVTRVMNRRVRLLAGHEAEPPLSSAGRPVGELIRAPALVCPPATSVQEAARQMAEAGATCVVVDTGDGLGIVTDRDIRTRVVAAGAGPETPLSEVMTAPAWTVSADRTGTEALLEMLDHGIRHLPVLDAGRRLLGVLDDVDLMANERRAPFRLQAAIARAGDAQEVAEAAAELPDTVIALFDAGPGHRRDQPRDHEHPRRGHAAADRVRARGARAPAGPVHVAGHRQLRPLRAVSELRRGLRASRGRARTTTWSCGAPWSRSPSTCWTASSVRVPA